MTPPDLEELRNWCLNGDEPSDGIEPSLMLEVPALIDEIYRLRAEVERLRAELASALEEEQRLVEEGKELHEDIMEAYSEIGRLKKHSKPDSDECDHIFDTVCVVCGINVVDS